jgi:hypothetical protein
MSMKNSSDTIGNQTRDVPVCSAVPQPTAPEDYINIIHNRWKLTVSITCIHAHARCYSNVSACIQVYILVGREVRD